MLIEKHIYIQKQGVFEKLVGVVFSGFDRMCRLFAWTIHVKSKTNLTQIIVSENVSQNDEILVEINGEFKVYNLQRLNQSPITAQLQNEFEGIESMVKIFMPTLPPLQSHPPSMKITRKLSWCFSS